MTPKRTAAAGPRAAVVGSGSWGTTFGKILADGDAQVTMWARRPELAQEINEAKRNSRYLPGINLPRTMAAHAACMKHDAFIKSQWSACPDFEA